jgi:hypothetical protein
MTPLEIICFQEVRTFFHERSYFIVELESNLLKCSKYASDIADKIKSLKCYFISHVERKELITRHLRNESHNFLPRKNRESL